MTISLPPDLERRLREQARLYRLEPSEYARRLLDEHLASSSEPAPPADRASIAVLEQWEAAHATDDPAELARRAAEGEAFMRELDRSRWEMEGPGARKLWP